MSDRVPPTNNNKKQLIKEESKSNIQILNFSCLIDAVALSNIIKRNIQLIYPIKAMNAYEFMNNGV